MEFEVGKYYKTRGGWKALVIYRLYHDTIKHDYPIPIDMTPQDLIKEIYKLLVIHKPDSKDKSKTVAFEHYEETGKPIIKEIMVISIDPPTYGKAEKKTIEHPADLVGEWNEENKKD